MLNLKQLVVATSLTVVLVVGAVVYIVHDALSGQVELTGDVPRATLRFDVRRGTGSITLGRYAAKATVRSWNEGPLSGYCFTLDEQLGAVRKGTSVSLMPAGPMRQRRNEVVLFIEGNPAGGILPALWTPSLDSSSAGTDPDVFASLQAHGQDPCQRAGRSHDLLAKAPEH